MATTGQAFKPVPPASILAWYKGAGIRVWEMERKQGTGSGSLQNRKMETEANTIRGIPAPSEQSWLRVGLRQPIAKADEDWFSI
jgi:hypothetical protein